MNMEMNREERIALYGKAVRYLGLIMFDPRVSEDGQERLPRKNDLYAYFDQAEDMQVAFETLCKQMVLAHTSDWKADLEPEKMWSAFLHPKGLASYEELELSEEGIEEAFAEFGYMGVGAPLLGNYVLQYLQTCDTLLIIEMEKALVAADIAEFIVDDFVDIMWCLVDEYDMKRVVGAA